MGLVDKLVRHRDSCAGSAARRCWLAEAQASEAGLAKRLHGRSGPLRGYVAKKMRDEAKKKARPEHYPAPYALIDLFEKHGG
jgi:3-hydroxyacyl-CoA dehydrogenase/enoyl-CoA hydratase/3-hydroxybutyryl-CoA epimerase